VLVARELCWLRGNAPTAVATEPGAVARCGGSLKTWLVAVPAEDPLDCTPL